MNAIYHKTLEDQRLKEKMWTHFFAYLFLIGMLLTFVSGYVKQSQKAQLKEKEMNACTEFVQKWIDNEERKNHDQKAF